MQIPFGPFPDQFRSTEFPSTVEVFLVMLYLEGTLGSLVQSVDGQLGHLLHEAVVPIINQIDLGNFESNRLPKPFQGSRDFLPCP